MAKPVKFPDEEEGMPGIHIDIHHDLGTGGDPKFTGGFRGAGAGGAEPVDEHKTGLAQMPNMGLDEAAGVRRGPGTAGAHPAMVGGAGSGVGAGEGPGGGNAEQTTEVWTQHVGAAEPSGTAASAAGTEPSSAAQRAAEAVAGAASEVLQGAKAGLGLGGEQ